MCEWRSTWVCVLRQFTLQRFEPWWPWKLHLLKFFFIIVIIIMMKCHSWSSAAMSSHPFVTGPGSVLVCEHAPRTSVVWFSTLTLWPPKQFSELDIKSTSHFKTKSSIQSFYFDLFYPLEDTLIFAAFDKRTEPKNPMWSHIDPPQFHHSHHFMS